MGWLKKIFSLQSSQEVLQSVLQSPKRQERRRETTSDWISKAFLKEYFEIILIFQ